MNYKMFVEEIPLSINIGLFPEERQNRQTVLCSLEIGVVSNGGDLDEISNTVNYYELTKAIQDQATLAEFKLLEPLAELILDIISEFQHVATAKVTLVKPKIMSALGAKACGVEVERNFA